ncbi:hypothetical protein KGM_205705 [Danaus plexippus plexippus]|uniref:Uncharacterized protein n=1 Tax=Danaus plexippus plexippus TaxID=278856 RepID=A0A212FEI9_DANPL|nr:hypothetical protein KGM_205705 [Danaus plexippus plexippus]
MERCGEGRDTRRGNDLDEHTTSVVEDKELKSGEGGGGGGGGPRHHRGCAPSLAPDEPRILGDGANYVTSTNYTKPVRDDVHTKDGVSHEYRLLLSLPRPVIKALMPSLLALHVL